MKVAIIDLGTNTFHLLIASINPDGQFLTLHRIRKYVYIGEEGVETLGQQSLHRAYHTLVEYQQAMEEYEVEKVVAFGTAALRTASNGKAFIEKVKAEIGIEIQTISGDREADLIYIGTKQAVPLTEKNVLIMDIGGGSVEFIIANQNGKIWAQSFPVGISVLYNQFHKTEPIAIAEIHAITSFLDKHFQPLYEALQSNPAHILVGASGTFDVISGMMGKSIPGYPHCERADLTNFPLLYDETIKADLAGRLAIPTIPNERAKLISVALVLINLILQRAKIDSLLVSAYAMKEGILWEIGHF